VKCLFTGRAKFSNWVGKPTFIIFLGLFNISLGPTSYFAYYNCLLTNPQKGIWSYYNNRHDQSTMGIDPINNISNNNKNTLCSYFISTLPPLASLGVSLDVRGSIQSDSVDFEPRHCASEDTLSEQDLVHVCKCV
jgi:hypothetical protein